MVKEVGLNDVVVLFIVVLCRVLEVHAGCRSIRTDAIEDESKDARTRQFWKPPMSGNDLS